MARVIRFHKTGGPEVLQIDEVDIGAPGPGELRLRVDAFGLNRAEGRSEIAVCWGVFSQHRKAVVARY